MRPSRPGAHPAPQGEVFTPARPALILHSARDDSALVQLLQALRDAHSDLVELETFAAGRTLSWNTDLATGRPRSPPGSGRASQVGSPRRAPLDAHLIRPRQDKPSSIRTPPGIIKHACPPGGTERGRTNVAEPWLSADDIAAHLGITKDTVYTWIAEKAMPAHKVGRLWKFQTSEIDEWVRRGGASASKRDEDAE